MKKIIVLVLFIIVGLNANTTTIEDEKARNAAMTLNYLHGSLNKIVLYNDKIVLEEEYNNIINNLNLTVIDDEELVQVITYLMDTLTQFRLSEMDREQFRKEYEEKLEGALTGALSGLANIRGSNPIELGVNAVLGIGSAYFNYKNVQKSLKKGLEKSTYALDKQAINDLNDIRKEFILTYWEVMKRYNMPDEWRVSEKQFTRLINILKDSDNEKVYRQLLRMKDELSVLPMYWYELSLIARKVDKKDKELEYIERFEALNNKLFRQDSMYSLLLANKLSYLNVNTEKVEIKELLEKIYKIDQLNANRKLFSAMKYIQLGDYNRADYLLTQNIDDGFLSSISGRLKLDIHLKTEDKYFESTMVQLLKEQNISAEEYLYYLAKRPTKLLLAEIKEEIKRIQISLNKSVYGKDDIIVKLPKNWVISDIEDTELGLEVNKRHYKFSEIKIEDEYIQYTFEEIIDLLKFDRNGKERISLTFNHKNVPVELLYEIVNTSKQVKQEKDVDKDSYLSMIKSKVSKTIEEVKNSELVEDIKTSKVLEYSKPAIESAKNVKDFLVSTIVFVPLKVFTENKCFDINHNMKECIE